MHSWVSANVIKKNGSNRWSLPLTTGNIFSEQWTKIDYGCGIRKVGITDSVGHFTLLWTSDSSQLEGPANLERGWVNVKMDTGRLEEWWVFLEIRYLNHVRYLYFKSFFNISLLGFKYEFEHCIISEHTP